MLTWDSIQANAVAFAKRWKDGRNEEAEAQSFTTDFLHVFGVDDPVKLGDFEYKVPLSGNRTGYIDYLWKGQIAIEMKSRGKDLNAAFEQLRVYMTHLPEDEIPDLWMVCDFETIRLSRRSTNEVYIFKTKDLRKHIKRFANIAGYATERARDNQVEVNVKAAEKMARLHDALKDNGYDGHDLEVYLVRLLFCMFADDTGIFPKDSFFQYVESSRTDGSDVSDRIGRLFEVLNMTDEDRTKRKLLSDELKQFRYINGGLFSTRLSHADFDAKMRQTLLDCINFDWNTISPAIFGAMFQGVMDKTQRREMGAHYTSEENILKLINPLFMDELWREFDRVKTDPAALARFHDKIARLKFLDPACGCGNFLIITYRELRVLELEVLKMKVGSNQLVLDISHLLKVSVEQFSGIEYEDFPCQIAQVGMWLMDHQMNLRASEYFGMYYARLPLIQSAMIVHGNALRIDWEEVVPKRELSFILGNPPFSGGMKMNDIQKNDLTVAVGSDVNSVGEMDYIVAWYYRAAKLIQNTSIACAFVSTNSIVQGQQAITVWKPLKEQYQISINFAYRTFRWNNEAKGVAAVHCVIVGFSCNDNAKKQLYDEDGKMSVVSKINSYLIAADNWFLQAISSPICNVPPIHFGSMPRGKAFIMTYDEKEHLIQRNPIAEKYIRKFYMGNEFINGEERFCLWLLDADPRELKKCPLIMERIEMIRKARLESKAIATQKLADTPTLFAQIAQPDDDYIAIPAVSTQRRKYIPIGFLAKEIIAGNKLYIIPNAKLYHFGILTSNVHMAWMRVFAGRMKSDYSYSKDIVYNNFPWPDATDEQKAGIEALAQTILDVRALFPDSSLADLYDPLTIPPELLRAHHNLDRAVMKLYGFTAQNTPSEATCVAKLMERYQKLVGGTICV